MTLTRIATCALLLLAAGSAHAWTAEELAAKNLEARGGASLDKVDTVRRSGQLIVNAGQFTLGYVETRQRPTSVREEASLQGLTQVESYDGKEGWRIDPFQGRKDPERTSADDLKGLIEDAQIGGPLEAWAARGATLEYMGTEDIDGTNAHKIRVTQKNGDIQYVYLDPDYFLEIRVESQRQVRGVKQVIVADFGEYEKVEGVYWATAITAGRKGDPDPAKIIFDKVEVNLPLAPDYFSFPAAN